MGFGRSRIVALLTALTALLAVAVPAASAQTSGWQAGPQAAGDNTYTGYVDTPSSGATVPGSGQFTVSGWVVDTTAQGWAGIDNVQVWLGTMDGGGTMLANAGFAQNRPDVAAVTGNPFFANSGFGAVVNGSSVPAGSQTLNVYAHTPSKGWWYKSVPVTGGGSGTGTGTTAPPSGAAPVLVVINPTENQEVSTKSDYTITGTVSDPAHIDSIEIWINGERNASGAQMLGTTTPNSDGSWSLSFTPTHYPSIHSNLFVYAHNKANGLETMVTRAFNIVDK
jgi:hypothetical protein